MRNIETLLEATHPLWIQTKGMIRMMAVTLTSEVLWQLTGVRMPDGSREVIQADVYSGIGFYARPPSSGVPQSIVASVVDASHRVIVALRDEKTRAAIAGAVKVGETMMYNDKAVVYVKDDGSIEARTAGGAAAALATKADVQALTDYLRKQFDATTGHTHTSSAPGNPTAGVVEAKGPGVTGTAPNPTGTNKFKAE